jgi:uncharacterized protein YutE (UPF0331/DUF86 family)
VIDISAELGARRGLRFEDYTEAVRNLSAFAEFPGSLVSVLERLPGFRNVLIHEYVALDLDRVIQALDQLQPVENFLGIVIRLESEEGDEEA